ncbi:putative baseplate assembly protein [Dyella choica]|uniref:Putative baseplate assembly protein n=1 Tax=Dyella choica TaxID=1927959 RepID=A0A432MAY1_9GAMM|nr:putative baseplate assembly protein [Dyella choica]RUL78922.1 putative baseplate assembly protein [Dyella choica]
MSCCSACGQHACACGCGPLTRTPLSLYNRPGLDSLSYRVGRYADFRATMQADLSDASLPALSGLRTREADDPSIALLDTWAVGAEVLSFYQERIANEGFLRTATERRSVLELGRLVDYRLRPGVAASVYLSYTIDQNSGPVTLSAGSRAQSVPAPGEQMQTFETAEPLDARYEWNAIKARKTQPVEISVDTIAGLDTIWISGINNNLKTGDRLLFLFGEDLAGGVQAIRLVRAVETDAQNQRSKILLQALEDATVQIVAAATKAIGALEFSSDGSNRDFWLGRIEKIRADLLLGGSNWGSSNELIGHYVSDFNQDNNPAAVTQFLNDVKAAFGISSPSSSGGGFQFLFDALIAPPTLQPANRFQLVRDAATALGVSSDTRPQMLLQFEPRLRDTFYQAWTSVSYGNPSPALKGVFAMRVTASLFGYNAPKQITLTQVPKDGGGTTTTTGYTDWTIDEAADVLSLDNAYDGVLAGGYVAIQRHSNDGMQEIETTVAQVQRASVHPRTDYGMSSKTTEITLVDTGKGTTVGGAVQPPIWSVPTWDVIRSATVFAQSEALTLAEQVLTEPVGAPDSSDTAPRQTQDDATHLTLDSVVDGLKSGRWVIVEGQRVDVPGTDAVTAAELVMIAAVEQSQNKRLSGDTVHSTLVLANQGLAYRYRRDSVVVHANVVRATHGETRNEVIGNGNGAAPMQTFTLKQSPLTYVSAPTVDGVQSTLSVSVNDVLWHEVRNLAFAGSAERSFVTNTDNDGKTSVTFGDGAHGARLPTGVENVKAVYRNGIGVAGNVRAGQVTLVTTKPLGVKDVINPLGASGGADPESRDQARRNVPISVSALDRLVSVSDYAEFARSFGGVGKASAVKSGAQVLVTIAGAADAPIDPSSDLYRNLLQAFQRYGDPALPVDLSVRELLALRVSAKVGLAPDQQWEAVEPLVRAAVLDRFGFERRELAQNVYRSELIACVQAVRGVAYVTVDLFSSFDRETLLLGFEGRDKPNNGLERSDAPSLNAAMLKQKLPLNEVLEAFIPVLPTRRDPDDPLTILPAQLAYLLPDIPDTLLLQEAT